MQNALRLRVHRLPGAEQRNRRQKTGQHEQQQADAVDADQVADPERRNPRMPLDELKVGGRRIKPRPHQQGLGKHQHGDDQRDSADHALVLLIVSHEEQRQRAEDGQRDERREDRKVRQERPPPGTRFSSAIIITRGAHDTEKERRGIGANRARLQSSQQLAPPRTDRQRR